MTPNAGERKAVPWIHRPAVRVVQFLLEGNFSNFAGDWSGHTSCSHVGMVSLRWLTASLVLSVVACSAAPAPQDYDRRSSSDNDDDEDDNEDKQESEVKSAPAPSGSSATPAPTSPPPASPPPPASSPNPTGPCDPSAAPAACTGGTGGTCTGLARCLPNSVGTGSTWGACECGLVPVPIQNTPDCSTLVCPATAPNVVGCALTFTGSDSKGCAARSSTTPSTIFFKEGDNCNSSSVSVSGTLFCSPTPSAQPLSAATCPMNKSKKFYPTSASACPN